MAKYRKKPVVIDAVQWTGNNEEEILDFCNGKSTFTATDKEIVINTLEGTMHASKGDYIIRGVQGEYYPCKPDIFEETYEKCELSL